MHPPQASSLSPAPHVPLGGTEARGGAQAPVHGRARGESRPPPARPGRDPGREQSRGAGRPSRLSGFVLCAAESRLALSFFSPQ